MNIKIVKKNDKDMWPYGPFRDEVLLIETPIYSRFIQIERFDDDMEQLFWIASTLEFLARKIKQDIGVK